MHDTIPMVEWLLDCNPREVQLEALLRSFYGFKSRDNRHEDIKYERIRANGPACGWGHFMEMRLGKTPTALNEFLLFQKYHGVKGVVILAPNDYKAAWVLEAKRFGVITPMMEYESGYAEVAEKFCELNKDDFGVVINYEALRTDDCKNFMKKILGPNVMLIADESIKIKNHASQVTMQAMLMSKQVKWIRELTGCPMTQGPQDIYSQLRFIKALDGFNFYAFRNKFCKMGGFKGKKIVGVRNEEALSTIINQNAFVAKRYDWGNPTNPEYYTINLPISPQQKFHYDMMDEELVTYINEEVEITVDQVITKMLKLQQISSGFIYDEKGEMLQLMPLNKTPKILRLKEILENETKSKVMVVYNYNASGDLLMEEFAHFNPAVIRSKAWMRANERNVEDEKLRFNNDPKCRMIIVNNVAGKYGHNLSGIDGDRCELTIFYENSFSLDDRIQIEMRPTAAEQDWTNVYMDFVCSSVEKRVIDALAAKEDVINTIVGAYNPNKVRNIVDIDTVHESWYGDSVAPPS